MEKKQMFTSYFSMARKFDPEKYALIGIAGKSPLGWKMAKTHPGLEYKRLSPSWDIWKTWHDQIEAAKNISDHCLCNDAMKAANIDYTDRFNIERLGRLNVESVIWDLQNLAGDKIPVLLCYEKPGDFCHRHLVADWLNKSGLVECSEFEF